MSDRPGRVRALVNLGLLIVAIVVVLQLAFTASSFNGSDFSEAKRVGTAAVKSCDRRGPIGLSYGYWDDCLVSIKWNGGNTEYGKLGRPHLFHADEVGMSVEIGDNGTSKNGRSYSRPTLPHRPILGAIGLILAVIAGIPALILLWAAWQLIRNTIGAAFRRH